MQNIFRTPLITALIVIQCCLFASMASAYEVVVGLGSTASKSVTAAMADRSQWPFVADNAWGDTSKLRSSCIIITCSAKRHTEQSDSQACHS